MKHSLFFSATSMLIAFPATIIASPDIILTSKAIQFVDGKSYGVNRNTIAMIIHLSHLVKNMLNGFLDESGNRIGLYNLEHKPLWVKALILIEEQLLNDPEAKNSILYKELKDILEKVKRDYIETMRPFLDDARGAKHQMVMLITEWAEKAGRDSTSLLEWANTEENEEINSFMKRIQTFAQFDAFCEDLLAFFKVLVNSCPKAREQYQKMREEKMHAQK
jgi:hypothetical protein